MKHYHRILEMYFQGKIYGVLYMELHKSNYTYSSINMGFKESKNKGYYIPRCERHSKVHVNFLKTPNEVWDALKN